MLIVSSFLYEHIPCELWFASDSLWWKPNNFIKEIISCILLDDNMCERIRVNY